MKDLFIDNNIAKNFSNPMDPEYKKLIGWLMNYDESKQAAHAHLVVSHKLLNEYYRSARDAQSGTSIPTIIQKLTREGRLIKISNEEIKAFQRQYFTQKIKRKLTSNREDWDHLALVLLSVRKYGLSLDDALVNDLRDFPGFVVWLEKRPEDLPYAD